MKMRSGLQKAFARTGDWWEDDHDCQTTIQIFHQGVTC